MIKANLKEVSFDDLAQHLASIEVSPVTITYEGGTRRLKFHPSLASVPSLSNIDVVCQWAALHDCSVSVRVVADDLVIDLHPVIVFAAS